jgi:Leucine-rich repeat (LRR) protein
MIKFYCLIFILTTFIKVNGQIIKIPDVNFKAKLLEANDTLRIAYDSNGKPIKIDFNNDNNIQVSEALKVCKLVISSSEISSLIGIENFTNLTILYCDRNQLEDININGLPKLKELDCDRNELVNLDISKNIALVGLDCSDNQLSILDISKNTALTLLDCSNNKINNLETSKNVSLVRFWCNDNQLVSLDLSKNLNLKEFQCNKNQLTSLDLSKNIFLTNLFCYANLLTALDLSKNIDLSWLQCSSNKLKVLDISSSKKISNNILSIIKNGVGSIENNNDLTLLKINIAIQKFDEIKFIKTDRSNVVISTYETSSGDLSAKCINYNPITNTCKDY